MKSTFTVPTPDARGLVDPLGTPGALLAVASGSVGFARLEELLWRELDHYRELCDVLTHEKELLTANRPESLPDLLEEQKRILHDARQLEPARMRALDEVSSAVGASRTLTLTELAERLAGNERVRLEKLRAALTHIVPRVDQINRINVLLIRNSMSFISTTVRSILEEGPQRTATYASSGRTAEPAAPRASWTDKHA